MFAIALIIAGIFIASARTVGQMAKRLFERLAGKHGASMVERSRPRPPSIAKRNPLP